MISMNPLFAYLAYHRISIKELAEKTNLSYISIYNMKHKNTFCTSNLDKVCAALNINIKDVMRYEP